MNMTAPYILQAERDGLPSATEVGSCEGCGGVIYEYELTHCRTCGADVHQGCIETCEVCKRKGCRACLECDPDDGTWRCREGCEVPHDGQES